ncbi:AAEL010251-PA [Aedes aegypti]|uniref:Translation initiation factor eIF2B subunit alpha n=2 Tax=Aedes aegypti TaxID=7159 RepID=Q16TG6_AEDAE|nr:translation initiation factor eIF-2B subunit alpha [Aedes aegypti]ABF18393.1 translation initiation factor 2B alpha subunit [Aedes aegypti]EAT33465.1 AAEL014262-PA [Aedes aegypti]EAT37782.1 AAEL010251-PA [Aedes aegypti]
MKQTIGNSDVADYFIRILQEDDSLSSGIAAIKTLLWVLQETEFDTVQELHSTIQAAVQSMRETDKPMTSVVSGSELFLRFITLAKFDDKTIQEVREIMLGRGKSFLAKLLESRNVVAKQATSFISDGCRILTHARSRTVRDTLILAAKMNKRFHVFVTQSFPDKQGEQMQTELEAEGIECTLILDSAIGYVMETVDMVFVGAEGVVESGGIINRVGTFTMAMCAREMKKPVYVLVESFKFSRLYPLNQRDLPNDYKYSKPSLSDISKAHPLVDYTPPVYITLLFTDLGILTPSAVSDELIKLYL